MLLCVWWGEGTVQLGHGPFGKDYSGKQKQQAEDD